MPDMIDLDDPFSGRKPTFNRLWQLRQQWQADGMHHEEARQLFDKIAKRYRLKPPNQKQTRRNLALIEHNQRRSGTRQALGTGQTRVGKPNKIPHRVREVIHAADKALRDGETWEEVVRNLAAVGLVEPDTFRQVLQQAPRLIPNNGVFQPKDLIRPQKEPTIDELAEFARLPVDGLKRLKRAGSSMYAHLRERFMMARMTPGERRVLEAVQYKQVNQSYERMTGQPFKPRKPRSDLGVPRPHYGQGKYASVRRRKPAALHTQSLSDLDVADAFNSFHEPLIIGRPAKGKRRV